MIYGSVISAIFIMAFAYIVLALTNKESGNMKLAGQIIVALVALVAVVVLIYGVSGRGHYGMMGRGMTKEKCEMMMKKKMKENPSMMQDAMKSKGTKGMMEKGAKKRVK
ncbi:MAG: hypothetical protein ABH860_03530 [bacterium]